MGWVFFQVFLAFGIGIAIVWWTWPKKKKEEARHGQSNAVRDEGEK
jgi:hypothetical protein